MHNDLAAGYRRNLVRAVPLVLLVPVVIAIAIVLAGYPFQPGPFVLGAVGWIVALALRAPVALVGMRILDDRQRVQVLVTGASGPAEELVRLVAVLAIAAGFREALWIGLGWGAIEVVYSLVNGFAILALLGRTDPEAEQARALLPISDITRPDAPLWGVVERTWATLLHIGFTLLVAAAPLLVVITIPVHSATNLLAVRVGASGGLLRVQAMGAAITAAVLIAAAAAWAIR